MRFRREPATATIVQPRPRTALSPALIYQSELQTITDFAVRYQDRETGGDLFGYWTHSGLPVICFATGPGPKATHDVYECHQDPTYLEGCHQVLNTQFGLQHVGAWHSHHRLHLPTPSGGDVSTVQQGMQEMGWSRFTAGIVTLEAGETPTATIGLFLFAPDHRSGTECEVRVLPGLSPIRGRRPSLPRGENGRRHLGANWKLRRPIAAPAAALLPDRWYSRPEVGARLARELKAFQPLRSSGVRFEMRPEADALVVSIEEPGRPTQRWRLEDGFPQRTPLIHDNDGAELVVAWDPAKTIAEQFTQVLAGQPILDPPALPPAGGTTPALSDTSGEDRQNTVGGEAHGS